MIDVRSLVSLGIVFVDRRTVVRKRILLHAPSLIEIIFRARAMQIGRPLVAVNPNHIIAFAPPRALEVGNRQIAADVMSLALGGQDKVVVLPREAFGVDNIRFRRIDTDFVSPSITRIFATKLRMKISDIVAVRRGILLVVNIEVLPVRRIAFVDEFDAGGAVKRHLQVAIQRATGVKFVIPLRGRGERNRVIRVDDFIAEPKEVA